MVSHVFKGNGTIRLMGVLEMWTAAELANTAIPRTGVVSTTDLPDEGSYIANFPPGRRAWPGVVRSKDGKLVYNVSRDEPGYPKGPGQANLDQDQANMGT